jgi:hypothetical protein
MLNTPPLQRSTVGLMLTGTPAVAVDVIGYCILGRM